MCTFGPICEIVTAHGGTCLSLSLLGGLYSFWSALSDLTVHTQTGWGGKGKHIVKLPNNGHLESSVSYIRYSTSEDHWWHHGGGLK